MHVCDLEGLKFCALLCLNLLARTKRDEVRGSAKV